MTDIEYLKKYYDGPLDEAISKLEQGIPVQYIVGNVNFFGNDLIVNSDVLIPRFETEELVDKTINYIKKYFNTSIDIVDLGTGSGCIAISLKKELDCNVTAVDISDKALEVAKKNASINKTQIKFINGDMLKPLKQKYDVIISNPPYISYDEEIMDIVKNNEPHLALFAKDNGLYFYDEILKNAHYYLKDKSLIAFEIGYKQAFDIKKMVLKYFPNSKVVIEKDLCNRDRFVFVFQGY